MVKAPKLARRKAGNKAGEGQPSRKKRKQQKDVDRTVETSEENDDVHWGEPVDSSLEHVSSLLRINSLQWNEVKPDDKVSEADEADAEEAEGVTAESASIAPGKAMMEVVGIPKNDPPAGHMDIPSTASDVVDPNWTSASFTGNWKVEDGVGSITVSNGQLISWYGSVTVHVQRGCLYLHSAELTSSCGAVEISAPLSYGALVFVCTEDDTLITFTKSTQAGCVEGALRDIAHSIVPAGYGPVIDGWIPVASPLSYMCQICAQPSLYTYCLGTFFDSAASSSNQSGMQVVVLSGPKNSGKSTACAYILNSILSGMSGRKAVAFVETDLGQPEFHEPGLISVNVVEDYVFGPSYTHTRKPVHSLCYGRTSPEADPGRYLRMVAEVWNFARTSAAKLLEGTERAPVIVVNTHGWVTGLGEDILRQLIELFTPTSMLWMDSDSVRWPLSATVTQCVESLENMSVTVVEPLSSVGVTASSRKLGAPDVRQRLLTACIAGTGNVSLLPIPFASCSVYVEGHMGMQPREYLQAVNGSVVYLLVGDRSRGGSCALRIRTTCPERQEFVSSCLIHSIDPATRTLFALVPEVALPALQQRIRSGVILFRPYGAPNGHEVYAASSSTRAVPYRVPFSISGAGTGSTAMRPRQNLGRRRLE